MANEFICSECGGDGTRCRCHEKRPYGTYKSQDQLRQEAIERCEREFRQYQYELENILSNK